MRIMEPMTKAMMPPMDRAPKLWTLTSRMNMAMARRMRMIASGG